MAEQAYETPPHLAHEWAALTEDEQREVAEWFRGRASDTAVTWRAASMEAMRLAAERGDLDERTVLAFTKHLVRLQRAGRAS